MRETAKARAVRARVAGALIIAASLLVPAHVAQAAGGDDTVLSFGDARFFGSTGSVSLREPIVGMAATRSGGGYWLVASDGGVFSFGDARFFGSGAGAIAAGRSALGIATPPGRDGYWLLAGTALTAPLHGGDAGPAVAALQRALLAARYWVAPTGVYDLVTEQAVTAVQKEHGLARSGVFDQSTRAALLAGVPAPRSVSGDLIEVDLARQVAVVVRGGQTAWVVNISTGKASTPTHPGSFAVNRQDPNRVASCSGCMYRPKYFDGGRAFHGYISVPPYAASHGCVRMTNAAMDFLWSADLVPYGSRVWVY